MTTCEVCDRCVDNEARANKAEMAHAQVCNDFDTLKERAERLERQLKDCTCPDLVLDYPERLL